MGSVALLLSNIRLPSCSISGQKLMPFCELACESTDKSHPFSTEIIKAERIARLINEHSYPDSPLYLALVDHIPQCDISSSFVEDVLGRLFAVHSDGLKAYEFFKFCLTHTNYSPTSGAFEKTLHILSRMRYFDKAWELMWKMKREHPSLLSTKSMGILLSKFAKFQPYENTLHAFKKLEKDIFVGRTFGSEEFNTLLRAFCTQKRMKEARSIFQKNCSRFSANTKTVNILLSGFKETRDIPSVELFYHDMVRRGFKPNQVTYNIRIDAYCKKGCFEDGLRLLAEMELSNIIPSLETITTLIHGAGIARNLHKARDLFNEIFHRNLQPDVGAYNALISAYITCKDMDSAVKLVDDMEMNNIKSDHVTYHVMFHGLIKSNHFNAVCDLFVKMTKSYFVPKMRTVVMLMKVFCVNRRLDLGLDLWRHLVERGYCPHSHSLDILVTGLCSHGRVKEAFECSMQMAERGRHISEGTYHMLQRFKWRRGMRCELSKLKERVRRLDKNLPPFMDVQSVLQSR